jgi:hypothetical protein
MSKAEIFAELPRLSPEDRQELRLRLAEIDGDDWLDDGVLTDSEKGIIEARFQDLEEHPQKSLPWEQVKSELMILFKT